MNETSDFGLGIHVVLDSSQDSIKISESCYCMHFDIHKQEGVHILYEVIVNDYVTYFVYEIWIIDQSKTIKRFYKERTIPLSEFRENFIVNVNVTHEKIAEKYVKQEADNQ